MKFDHSQVNVKPVSSVPASSESRPMKYMRDDEEEDQPEQARPEQAVRDQAAAERVSIVLHRLRSAAAVPLPSLSR